MSRKFKVGDKVIDTYITPRFGIGKIVGIGKFDDVDGIEYYEVRFEKFPYSDPDDYHPRYEETLQKLTKLDKLLL